VLKDLDIFTLEEQEKDRHFLVVELHDSTQLGPNLLHQIQTEVASIFSRAGFGILWIDDPRAAYHVTDQPYEARVYIRSMHTEVLELQDNHMGCVLTDSGEPPGPVIHISRNSIEKLITRGRTSFPPHLARALARVMAHELSHRFLRDSGHTKRGILKPKFSREALIHDIPQGVYFTKEQVRFIRSFAPTIADLQHTSAIVGR
jgi:hypothetical protein